MKQYWEWSQFLALIVVVAPFSLGILLLEVIGPSEIQIAKLSSGCQGLVNPNFIPGKITYVAVTSLHLVVCIIIGIRYVFEPKKTPGEKRFICRARAPTAIILLLLLLLGLIMQGKATYTLLATETLKNIYDIGDVGCNFSLNSTSVFSRCEFEIASILPVISAVIATAILVTYTNLQVYRFLKAKERDREKQLYISYNSIVQCLPMYSCLLVTAVISSAVWFHLPVAIFANRADGDVLENLRNYGDEMTLFLGITYTLTALVAFAWPMWRLTRKAKSVNCSLASSVGGQRSNQEAAFVTNKFLAVLAPLVTSLLYNLLEGVI